MAIATFIWLTAAVVSAAEMDMEQVIDSRQRNLRDMGAAFKAIGDQLKRSTPNMSEMAQYARSLKEISAGQKLWFPAGSGPEAGVKTAAKAEIWSQPAEFEKWEDQLLVQVDLLVKATAGTDVEAVRKQHAELGKVCGGCHKPFREKED